jgi:hypothetical protein
MRGIKDFNFPAFASATKKLRDKGHVVFSPAEKDLKTYGSLKNVNKAFKQNPEKLKRDVIRSDLNWIIDNADAVAILPKWHGSKGVAIEKALAKFLDLKIIYLK